MHMLSKLSAAAALAGTASAWLPEGKIRGVNLGTLFIYEPWIDNGEWSSMGCDGQKSEFDCVSSLGQDAADAAFQKHWQSWLTTGDLDEIKSYGLNTIRIPVGYWFKEDLVDSSEHFPKVSLDSCCLFMFGRKEASSVCVYVLRVANTGCHDRVDLMRSRRSSALPATAGFMSLWSKYTNPGLYIYIYMDAYADSR